MARRYVDTKNAIGYCNRFRQSVRCDRLVESDVVGISTGPSGAPILSMNQARTFAERILQWCDDAEKNR